MWRRVSNCDCLTQGKIFLDFGWNFIVFSKSLNAIKIIHQVKGDLYIIIINSRRRRIKKTVISAKCFSGLVDEQQSSH